MSLDIENFHHIEDKRQLYQQTFDRLCRQYYESCQSNTPSNLNYLLTAFDSCIKKDGIFLDLAGQNANLPQPSTSDYSDFIDHYRSIGFDSQGRMIYPEDYSVYVQIKNTARSDVHASGQLQRLALLDRAITSSQIQTSISPSESLNQFITIHKSLGSSGFLLGLGQFLLTQSYSDNVIEWTVDVAHFVETGIIGFEETSIQLLRDLQCTVKKETTNVVIRISLAKLQCTELELLLHPQLWTMKKHARPVGKVVTLDETRQCSNNYGGYLTWCSLSLKAFFIHVFY
ncbi:hypothetical protein BC833DRAFT_590935 [Globomyces pollinis-pini]|nr:hypothetical protein BC833DRAFT_590935 [Globomyces pollinis-pini]